MPLLQDAAGCPLTCQGQEALESFNKGLVAFVTLRESCVPWFKEALEKDPDFAMAHVMLGFLLLFDLNPPSDPRVAAHLEAVGNAVCTSSLHKRELAYVTFLQTYASCDLLHATEMLTAMLVDHPQDGLALRVLHVTLLFLSEFERLRDTLAWVLSSWSEDMLLYPFVMAIYAFAVEECNERERAEKILQHVLDLNRDTPFAYHAMSHVLEESKRPSDGVDFLTASRSIWSASMYDGHLTWHLALYHLELGDTDAVLREFDDVLYAKATSDNYLGLIDASSLLWRLEVSGVDPGEERWGKVTDAMATRVHNHRMPWFSAHIMMTLARGRVSEAAARLTLAQGMLKSMEEYCAGEGAFNQDKCAKLGIPVCNALLAFGKEKYEEVLQIMLPLHHDLHSIGGSWAQRQVFNSTLIEAAIRADNLPVAIGLVAELSSRKPENQRLKELLSTLQQTYHHNINTPATKKIKLSN